MPLSWNEIRHRAIAFSNEWTGVTSERAEKQTFWNEFFNVFGMTVPVSYVLVVKIPLWKGGDAKATELAAFKLNEAGGEGFAR